MIDGSKVPDGKTLQEVLTDEGFIAQIDAQKEAMLRAHLADLARAIPAEKVAALERIVEQEIAPGVCRTTRLGPPVAMPPPCEPPIGQ